jgi:lysozyme
MDRLIKMLKRHEGVKSHAYQCTAKRWTIGVGRNIDADGGIGLSEEEIDYLLRNDIRRIVDELDGEYPWFKELDATRKDAMVDISFNLGATRLRGFKKALAAMAAKDYRTAAIEFLDSRWARQVGTRALELVDLIEHGDYAE